MIALSSCPDASIAQDDGSAPAAHDIPFSPVEAILLKSVLIAINQANQSNNYVILRGMFTKEFAAAYTPAQLSELFKPWRAKKRDFGFVAIAFPSFDRQPSIDAKGDLRLQGSIPTPSFKVAFDFTFKRRNNRWALNVINLSDGVTTVSTEQIGAGVASAGGTAGDDVIPAPENAKDYAKETAKGSVQTVPGVAAAGSVAVAGAAIVAGDAKVGGAKTGAPKAGDAVDAKTGEAKTSDGQPGDPPVVPKRLPPLPRARPWPL